MAKGNMKIKDTVTYDSKTRDRITSMIVREFKKVEEMDPTGMAFANHMLGVLTKAGFTAPDGKPLNIRGVRYQVLRSGIRFQGARPFPTPAVTLDAPKPAAPLVREATPAKTEILRSLSKLPPLLERIVMAEDVSPQQRAALVEAWFEVKK